MKSHISYLVFVLIISVVLIGCGAKGTDSESPSPTQPSETPTQSIAPEESEAPKVTLLEEFRSEALSSTPADELFQELKQTIVQVPATEADEIIRAMEAYYEKHLPDLEKKLEDEAIQQELSVLGWPFMEDQLPLIKSESVRVLVEQALAGGYKLETTEGYVFPIVDYSKLLAFGDRVTTGMKSYLALMSMESDHKTASDGGLVISLEELSNRILAAESYVVTFPDSIERVRAEDRFIQYLSYYLIGLNNTPIFDYETFVLLPEVKAHYEQLAASHSGTVTGQLTEEFLLLLHENSDQVFLKDNTGNQIDIPEIKAFRESIESKARSRLPQLKNKN